MKKNTLNTKGLKRIFSQLAAIEVQIQMTIASSMKNLLDAIDEVERSHKNIVAAHKAHRTMTKKAKQK